MKKHRFLWWTALLACALGAGPLAAQTTATDQIGTSYSTSGQVILLAMVNNNRVSLRLYAKVGVGTSGAYGASEAGAEPTLGGGAVAYASGGRLQYTLYGQPTCKITVQTETLDYVDGALAVMALSGGFGSNGGHAGFEGLATSPGKVGFVPINYKSPQDYIVGIPGTDTWTNTGRNDGIQVRYRLNAHPGGVSGGSVVVLYTILNS